MSSDHGTTDFYYDLPREVSGTFDMVIDPENTEAFDSLLEEPRYDLKVTMSYQWTRWDRAWNAILRFLRLTDYRLPESYEVTIPGTRITNVSKSDERIRVDWKLDG